MRNCLSINQLQGVQGGTRALLCRVGCDPEKFFCIFFGIRELRHIF